MEGIPSSKNEEAGTQSHQHMHPQTVVLARSEMGTVEANGCSTKNGDAHAQQHFQVEIQTREPMAKHDESKSSLTSLRQR